jgi:type VI protein secretion system component Hcp
MREKASERRELTLRVIVVPLQRRRRKREKNYSRSVFSFFRQGKEESRDIYELKLTDRYLEKMSLSAHHAQWTTDYLSLFFLASYSY